MIIFHELNCNFSKEMITVLNIAWEFFCDEKGLHDVCSFEYQVCAEYFYQLHTRALEGL
jgi:hypothetical protein